MNADVLNALLGVTSSLFYFPLCIGDTNEVCVNMAVFVFIEIQYFDTTPIHDTNTHTLWFSSVVRNRKSKRYMYGTPFECYLYLR